MKIIKVNRKKSLPIKCDLFPFDFIPLQRLKRKIKNLKCVAFTPCVFGTIILLLLKSFNREYNGYVIYSSCKTIHYIVEHNG